jgi:single-stranded-DNA-specific exonuclease
LVERFCRPVFVLSDEDGEVQGSGRSIPVFHLLDALEAMPELFSRFGGHRQAAGVSMKSERAVEFRRRLNDYAAARLTVADFRPHLAIDAIANLNELTDRTVEELLSLAPFGFGNPAPVLGVLDAEVRVEPVVMKDRHLRVQLRQNSRSLFPKAWNFAGRAGEMAAGSHIDFAIALEEDTYASDRGGSGWQAILKDVRPVEMKAKAR